MRVLSCLRGVVVAVGMLLGIAAVPMSAHAQDTIVACNTPALIKAINDANATPAPDTLSLAPGCLYSLMTADNDLNGLPVITTPITIAGNNSTIARTITAPQFRIFDVGAPNGNLTLNNLTVTKGDAAISNGGGILVDNGRGLTLNSSRVTDNKAGPGGGIFSSGTVTLNSSTLSGNFADASGGGIIATDGTTTTVNNSRITHNEATDSGGGVVANGSVTFGSNSLVANNTAASAGGGIFVGGLTAGTTALNNAAVTDNTANGTGPAGGGIFVFSGKTLNVSSSHIDRNHAPHGQGAGLANEATATLRGSTVNNNIAGAPPGGIGNNGTVTLIATTVTGNIPTNCVGSPVTVNGCTL
jgi:hypothetical protein